MIAPGLVRQPAGELEQKPTWKYPTRANRPKGSTNYLQAAVVAHFCGNDEREAGEGVVLSERRHRDALGGALAALERFLAAASAGEPLECLALEVREALAALGQITGETTPAAILEQIFSRFCIGK